MFTHSGRPRRGSKAKKRARPVDDEESEQPSGTEYAFFIEYCSRLFDLGKKPVRSSRGETSGGDVIGPARSTPKVEKKVRSRARTNAEKDNSDKSKTKGRKIKKEPKLDATLANGGYEFEIEIEDPDSIERGTFSMLIHNL